jgi:hypothetical protein
MDDKTGTPGQPSRYWDGSQWTTSGPTGPAGPAVDWSGAPPQKTRSKLWRVGTAIGVVVVLLVVAAVVGALLPNQKGKVLFVTDQPSQGTSCRFDHTVTSMDAGTHAWLVIVFKDTMDDQPVTAEIFYNGLSTGSYTWPVSETKGLDCGYDDTDLSDLQPGEYKVVVTHRGEVEAEGTLTVK